MEHLPPDTGPLVQLPTQGSHFQVHNQPLLACRPLPPGYICSSLPSLLISSLPPTLLPPSLPLSQGLYIDQADFNLVILLPQPPRCWISRCPLSCPTTSAFVSGPHPGSGPTLGNSPFIHSTPIWEGAFFVLATMLSCVQGDHCCREGQQAADSLFQ